MRFYCLDKGPFIVLLYIVSILIKMTHEYNTHDKRLEFSINQENILAQLQENIINNINLSINGLRDEIISKVSL